MKPKMGARGDETEDGGVRRNMRRHTKRVKWCKENECIGEFKNLCLVHILQLYFR